MEITDRVHEHGRACWWDHLPGRWVCAPAPAAPAPPPVPDPAAQPARVPVPGGPPEVPPRAPGGRIGP